MILNGKTKASRILLGSFFLTDRLSVGPVICSFDLFCVSGSAAGTYTQRPNYFGKRKPLRKSDDCYSGQRLRSWRYPVVYYCKLFLPPSQLLASLNSLSWFSSLLLEQQSHNPLHKNLECNTNNARIKLFSSVIKAMFPLGYFTETVLSTQEPGLLNILIGTVNILIFWLLITSLSCS